MCLVVIDRSLYSESQSNDAIGTGHNPFCPCRLPCAGPTEILQDRTILSVGKVKADIQKSLLDLLTDKLLIVFVIYRIGLFKTVGSS